MGKDYQVRLSGYGGQGLVLAGIILGEAASIHEDRHALQSQSYGPEARGGASRSEVVISDDEIDFLEVTEPDLVVALTQQAYDLHGKSIKNGGCVIVEEDAVKVDTTGSKHTYALPFTRIAREQVGKTVVTNMVALGAISAITSIVSIETLKKAVAARVPRGTEEMNMKALNLGYEAASILLQARGETR